MLTYAYPRLLDNTVEDKIEAAIMDIVLNPCIRTVQNGIYDPIPLISPMDDMLVLFGIR